jgi:hypothetical protein
VKKMALMVVFEVADDAPADLVDAVTRRVTQNWYLTNEEREYLTDAKGYAAISPTTEKVIRVFDADAVPDSI